MSIFIATKIPCNTVEFFSNKEKKPPKITLNSQRVAYRYPDIGIIVLKPDMDRLTFGFSPTQDLLNEYAPGEDLGEYKEYIKKALWGSASYEADNLTLAKGIFTKPPYSLYNVNIRYTPPGAPDGILIQIDPKKPNRAFMRFDMNPSKLQPKHFLAFQAFLKEAVLSTPSGAIPYQTFIDLAPVYRADIAVDILGGRPEEMEIITLAGKKPSQQKKHLYVSKTGRKETVYLKAKAGKPSNEYVYDKRTEQLEAGLEPIYGDFLHSRFECRMQKTTFAKLAKTHNRCQRVSIRVLNYLKYKKIGYVDRLFINHALARDLQKALALVPAKMKPKHLQSYNKAMCNVWDADGLWLHWKDTVQKSALFHDKK